MRNIHSCGIQATKTPSKKKELANASSPFACLESLLRIKLDSKTLHDLVYGNWRGIMAPADISQADYNNFIKVIDIMHISPSWREQLKKNNWDNEFEAGAKFKSFLEKHIPEINKVMKGLGI